MSSSYINKLIDSKFEDQKKLNNEIRFKNYNDYKNYINYFNYKSNKTNKIINLKELQIHEFITQNLVSICNILDNLKLYYYLELININYSLFVEIFYNNISVIENCYETESDSDYDEEYDDYEY